jgi:hypothetical protein
MVYIAAPVIMAVSKAHIDGELKTKRLVTSKVINKTNAVHNQCAALPTLLVVVSIIRSIAFMAEKTLLDASRTPPKVISREYGMS